MLFNLRNYTELVCRNIAKMATKLYVGNLSESATVKHVRELFENFGQIDEVAVLRGFGFVVS